MTDINVGKGLTIAVDFSAMPQAALDHILYIGARNVLMDCHASVTAAEYPDEAVRAEVALAMVDKKLAALMAGEVRSTSTRETADPVRAAAIREATQSVKTAIKKAGGKPADYEAADIRAAADRLIAKDASILERAKEYVAKQKAAKADIDLSDLGL